MDGDTCTISDIAAYQDVGINPNVLNLLTFYYDNIDGYNKA